MTVSGLFLSSLICSGVAISFSLVCVWLAVRALRAKARETAHGMEIRVKTANGDLLRADCRQLGLIYTYGGGDRLELPPIGIGGWAEKNWPAMPGPVADDGWQTVLVLPTPAGLAVMMTRPVELS